MTIIPDRVAVLDDLVLGVGAHDSWEQGACVLEAVAWIAGEAWSDNPECASPVVGAFLRTWNDTLDDTKRQDLKRYIPRLVGSRGTPAQEDARAWMAMDWLIRTYTPVWLRAAGLNDQADLLTALPEARRGMDVPSIRQAIDAVRKDAAAARAAAGDATRDAARDAAGDAARDAAQDAARDATWDAAQDAARDALRAHVEQLQAAAHQFLDRMLKVTEAA